ncbi:MAG: HAD hydrolase family protein, partial [Prevotella sp.]|nr:HAD hydrolase family protein [Candidatus Prevotella equi]
GMTPEDLIAFGDSYNDLTMLQLAGKGVAMGNAEQAVKDVADYVTDTNENDGVGRFLATITL